MVPVLALTLMAALGAQDPQTGGAAAVVRHAIAAVEGDSVAHVQVSWRRRLDRDPRDRLAVLGLATLARDTYGDSLAERLYRSLLPTPGKVGDGIAAHAALGVAVLWRLQGRLAQAESAFVAASVGARASGDSALAAEALVLLSSVVLRQRPVEADSVLAEGAALLPRNDARVRALFHCGRGEVLERSGRPGAEEEARRGAAIAARAGEARVRASCLHLLALVHERTGQLDSAIHYYSETIAQRRRARDRAGLAQALQWRGYVYRTLGWLGRARRDLEAALIEGEVAHRAVVPWAYANLAHIALAAGDPASGATFAARADDRFAAQGDVYSAVGMGGLRGALALAAGDPALARRHYAETAQRARAIGWAESDAGSRLFLSYLALQDGDGPAAAHHLDEAERTMRARGMRGRLKGLAYHRGVLALRTNRLEEAERLFRAGLAAAHGDEPQWRYRYGARLAEVLVRRGHVAVAGRELAAAAEALDAWRDSLDDRALRLLAFQVREYDPDADLGVATIIAALAASGRVARETAFELAERARARDLADRLNRAAALDTTAGDAARRRAPGATVAALGAALPDSTALLEYVTGQGGVGGEPTTLFVVTRGGARSYRLSPEDSLTRDLARLTVLLESGAEPRSLARALGAALLDSALADLDPTVTRLVVVPDGALHRVPFDALVLADGRYVLERFAVGLAPSAGVATQLWSRVPRADTGEVLVLADPAFPGETDAGRVADVEVFRAAVAGQGSLPRLRATAREARQVARHAAATHVRRRGAASEAWLKRAPLAAYRVVHLATHALVDESSLTHTALALAPGEGEDGFLGPTDLARLELAADLVVLSACRTAGGALVRGEGVQGLTAPLLEAGARAVVATTWPIEDGAVVPLVGTFYEGLAAGLPAGDALRRAKLNALQRGAPARDWAAFTIVGDQSVRVPLVRPRSDARAWWLVLALALLTGGLYGSWMRNRSARERT